MSVGKQRTTHRTLPSSLGVKEEDTPMGSENVDMNFNGGDLDDNEVNPSM